MRVLSHPVDIAWLCAFRALFGAAMCVSMLRIIAYGWLDDFFVKPGFHFSYWGFGWIVPLAPDATHALAWTVVFAALAVVVGFAFRLFAAVLFSGLSYLQLIDVSTYLNHYYLASLLSLLLACSPAGQAYSVDRWLATAPGRTTVPAGWSYLFRFQVAIVYTFAGVAKATSDWLVHAQPLSIWLGSRTGLPIMGVLFDRPITAELMSWAGFLFDSTIALWLMWKRTRAVGFVTVVVFHVLTRWLFPIGMFPVIMVLSALVFFSPSWPRRWLRIAPPEQEISSAHVPPPPRWPVLGGVAVAVYCVLQIAIPLRFMAYGGNVLWHERGMRFSWRVMVREKNGSVTYLVRSKVDGRAWEVRPAKYLTRHQEREMSSQPDLILQLAHRIGDDTARQGLGPVEVRADSVASLNGRPLARLIDPNIDLTTVRDGLGRADWILPAPEGPPPAIRPARR